MRGTILGVTIIMRITVWIHFRYLLYVVQKMNLKIVLVSGQALHYVPKSVPERMGSLE